MDLFLSHAFTCKCGGGVVDMHGGVAHIVWEAMRAAGYRALREVVVPEWSVRRAPVHNGRDLRSQLPFEEAVLDVVGWGAVHSSQCIVDTTVRHPLAKKYMPQAAHTDGYANLKAAEIKATRYPDRAGLHLTTASIESFGRLGKDFEALLNDLAAAANHKQRSRGLPKTRWLHKWKSSLSLVLARGTARSVSEALHGNGQKIGGGH